jgi:hypothetical protein
LAGETEVLGENLLKCHFVHHKPHMLPGREPGYHRFTKYGVGVMIPDSDFGGIWFKY